MRAPDPSLPVPSAVEAPVVAPPGWPPAAWLVRLLGTVDVVDREGPGARRLRLPSRAAAALLARLALWPERAHAREELVELLWPGVTLAVGRNRLRQTLSVLRHLLEAGGAPGGAMIVADRTHLRAAPGAFACDVRQFEAARRAGRADEARAWVRGELMPGFYDEWIVEERERLQALFDRLPEAADAAAAPAAGRRPETAPAFTPMPPSSRILAAAPAPAAPALGPISQALGPTAPAPAPGAPVLTPGAPVLTPAAPVLTPGAPTRRPSSALPHYLTPAFGLDVPGARLREAIAAHRLVTLVGPGGSGKTRLAVEVAHALELGQAFAPHAAAQEPEPPAGHWSRWRGWLAFVPMIACETGAQLVDRLAMTLRIDPIANEAPDARGASGPLAALVQALAEQPALLVFDNLEQVAADAAALVTELLGALPLLRIVATSRHVLGVDGEHLVPVEPLPLPALPTDIDALRALALNPAVALYIDRARERRSDFHLTARNAADIVALVGLLDGHPLAIELAAARVRSTAPAQWVALLRAARSAPSVDTLALLARQGPRGASDPRHASMLDVIAWSWRLLDEGQQEALCALTVFDGGCDAAAAHAVVDPQGSPARMQLVLDELVSSSLIVARESADGRTRFEPYETVREFAAARADAAAGRRWRSRHRAWLAALGRATLPGDATPDLARLRIEMPNLLRALASALADEALDDAWRLVWAHRAAFADVALPATGLELVEAALAATDDAPRRLLGHAFLAAQTYEAGRHALAARHAEAVLALAGEPTDIAQARNERVPFAPDDEPLVAWGVCWALRTQMRVGRALSEDDPRLAAALTAAQAAGDAGTTLAGRVIGLQASLLMRNRRDYGVALPLRRESLALWKASRNRLRINEGLIALAICLGFQHRTEEQLPLLAEVEREALAIDQPRLLCFALSVRGYCLADMRRHPEALSAYLACVRQAVAAHAWRELFYGLWNVTRTLAHLRQPERAAQLMGFAEAFYAGRFGQLGPEDLREPRRTRRLCAAQIGAAATQAAWREGAGWDLGQAIAAALEDEAGA